MNAVVLSQGGRHGNPCATAQFQYLRSRREFREHQVQGALASGGGAVSAPGQVSLGDGVVATLDDAFGVVSHVDPPFGDTRWVT